MIDLHCHMLPGIDDGAADLDTALAMARMAVADGIKVVACTPHIYPGLYDNDAAGIAAVREAFQAELDARDIPLRLYHGADTYLDPNLVANLRAGRIPTLAGSRYLLLEPPHHVAPPRFDGAVFELMAAGYVPVITHPERLSWTHDHYAKFAHMARHGVWMQITCGSLTGRFGRPAQHLAERMLDDGLVHLLATDAHNLARRPPLMEEGRAQAAKRVGAAEAQHLVDTRPAGIVADADPQSLPALPAPTVRKKKGGWKSLFFRHNAKL